MPSIRLRSTAAVLLALASSVPFAVQAVPTGIIPGHSNTCALLQDGTVQCWGYNGQGQLGDGTTTTRPTAAAVKGLPAAVQKLATGAHHSCVLLVDGRVRCWGDNLEGALGDGTVTPTSAPIEPKLTQGSVVALAGGSSHTCAINGVGGVLCWGLANFGQLGNGSDARQLAPVPVANLETGVASIATGEFHTCAVMVDGTVKCWGANFAGQAGIGLDPAENYTVMTPADVVGLGPRVKAVAAGNAHTCALTVEGGVKCWGSNTVGELGAGVPDVRSLVPLDVVGLTSGVAAIAAGTSHTCALTTNGGVKCWGQGRMAGVGAIDPAINFDTPTDVTGLSKGVVSLSVAYGRSCVITDAGQALCWGTNGNGGIGDGTTIDRFVPTEVRFAVVAPAVLALTPGSFPFGIVDVGATSAPAVFTLSNSGGSGATLSGFTASGEFAISAATCADSLAAGASCTVSVNARPQSPGAKQGTLLLTASTGTMSAALTATGIDPATVPVPFAFPAQNNVLVSTLVTSAAITPTGFTARSPISVVSGEYSIRCGTEFTTTPGTIDPGQAVCVRHTSARNSLNAVTTRLTIGGVTGSFRSLTANGGAIEQAITFQPPPDVLVSTKSVVLDVFSTGSANPVVFTSRSTAVCTVSGNTVTILAIGTCAIAANKAGDATFAAAAEVLQTFGVLGLPQAIDQQIGGLQVAGTTLDIGPRVFVYPAGLPVVAASLSPATCTVAGNVLSFLAVGTCSLTLDQPGNATYAPAPRVSVLIPVTEALRDIVAIATGSSHACAVTIGGRVKCWGYNASGQLGDGSTTTHYGAVDVPALPGGVQSVTAGDTHTCALMSTGAVKCWGFLGEYSDDIFTPTPVNHTTPVAIAGLAEPVVSLSAGAAHTCAVMASGRMACWGDNTSGQVDPAAAGPFDPELYIPVPRDLSATSGFPANFAQVSSGTAHTCAVTRTGEVHCWGANDKGQAGNGNPIAGLGAGVTAVAAGEDSSCAVTSTGAVKCWGRITVVNSRGEPIDRYFDSPQNIPGLGAGYRAVAVASTYCALSAGGAVACKSFDGSAIGIASPAGLDSGVSAVSIASNFGFEYGCALMAAGTVKCWGEGLLGNNTGQGSFNPVYVQADIDSTPDAFSFTPRPGVLVGEMVTSQAVTPVAYNQVVPVTVVNGEYSVGCAGAFTATAGALAPGQAVCVRHVASTAYTTAVTTTLKVGATTATFTSTTASGPALAVSPGSLAFGDQPVGTGSVARTIIVTNPGGHVLPGLVSGASGDFGVGSATCGATLAAGASCTLSITFTPASLGGRSGDVIVSASAPGITPQHIVLFGNGTASTATPAPFAFVDQFLVPTSVVAISAPVLISGIAPNTRVTVIGGEWAASSTNSCIGDVVAFTAQPGTMSSGQYACVRHTTSPIPGGSNDTQLIVGGLGDTFTTITIDTVPAPFAFPPVQGATPGTPQVSAAATITGINAPSGISVVGGEYSVGCGGAFTQAPGTILGGQSVCVRHVAAAGASASTLTTLTVGGVSAAFESITAGRVFSGTLLSSSDVLDFGGQSVQTTAPRRSVTFTNDTANALAITSLTAPAEFAVTHDCAVLASGASCRADVAFRPAAAGARSGTLVVVSAAGVRSVSLAGLGEATLTTHYYRAILGRSPDAGGRAYWDAQAVNLRALGVNVNEAWIAMASAFFASSEYAGLGRDGTSFITDLYVTFFDRQPDAAGLAFWSGQLAQGMPREVLLASFMFSTEFTGFTRAIFGETPTRAESDMVVDFYRGLLARLPDEDGLAFWRGRFRAAQCSGPGAVTAQAEDISSAFALSPEYGTRARDHSAYVGDLYNAFMRRGGDLAGVQHWIEQLSSGAQTREQLRRAFIATPEFQARVQAVVAAGCMP